jgi:hypothetical protein
MANTGIASVEEELRGASWLQKAISYFRGTDILLAPMHELASNLILEKGCAWEGLDHLAVRG